MQLFLLSSVNRVHQRGDKEKSNSCSILKYIINLFPTGVYNEYQVFSLKWPHYRQLHFNSLRTYGYENKMQSYGTYNPLSHVYAHLHVVPRARVRRRRRSWHKIIISFDCWDYERAEHEHNSHLYTPVCAEQSLQFGGRAVFFLHPGVQIHAQKV